MYGGSLASMFAGRYGGSGSGSFGGGGSSDPRGSRYSELLALLDELERSRSTGRSAPATFRDLPEEHRRQANRQGWLALASAMSEAEPGRLGSAMLRGELARQGIRSEALERYQGEAEREEQMRRAGLQERLRIAQLRREVEEDEERSQQQLGLQERLSAPPAGFEPGLWTALPVADRVKVLRDDHEEQQKRRSQEEIIGRLRTAATTLRLDPDLVEQLHRSGMTPQQALAAAKPDEPTGQLTAYQSIELARQRQRDAEERERRGEEDAGKRQQREQLHAFLRKNGLEPTGNDELDEDLAQQFVPKKGRGGRGRAAAGAGGGAASVPPERGGEEPGLPDRLFGGGSTARNPPPKRTPLPGGPAAPTGSIGASVSSPFRGEITQEVHQNGVAAQREKQADTIIKASMLPPEVAADPDLRAAVIAELAKPGSRPQDVLVQLRARAAALGVGGRRP